MRKLIGRYSNFAVVECRTSWDTIFVSPRAQSGFSGCRRLEDVQHFLFDRVSELEQYKISSLLHILV